MSIGQMKNNPRGLLQVKEIQRFFNKVNNIIFIPKDLKSALAGIASMILILSDEDYQNAKHYGLNDNMERLLGEKYPRLHIHIRQKNVSMSIMDEDFDIEFLLPDQPLRESLLRFVRPRDWYGKIAVVFAGPVKPNDTLESLAADILIVLDGFILD